MNLSKKQIIIGNFLGGLSWGLGTVIGASVVVAVLVYGLNFLGLIGPDETIFGSSPVLQKTLPGNKR